MQNKNYTESRNVSDIKKLKMLSNCNLALLLHFFYAKEAKKENPFDPDKITTKQKNQSN